MKPCGEECCECCDFCRLFNFNGDENGVYVGRGYCVKFEIKSDPGDVCGTFICARYKDEEVGEVGDFACDNPRHP